jgi:hypothetical protein
MTDLSAVKDACISLSSPGFSVPCMGPKKRGEDSENPADANA